ncbi:MAG: rod shape-determining protein RodA [Opitutales bacterium]|nr:rod shape-determining protein RodA [Opitutales bacterium]
MNARRQSKAKKAESKARFGSSTPQRSGIDGREVLRRGRPVFSGIRILSHSGWDWIAPLCILILGVMGVMFIYSAQHFTGSSFWVKQILWFAIGAIVYGVISWLDYGFWFRNAHICYAAGVILLLLLWTPIGMEREGSRRWLNLPGIAYQPSEGAKIGTLIMVSAMLARERLGTVRESLWALVKLGIAVSIPIFLIFLQPDLGSALVFGPMIFSLLYVSRLSQRFFIVVLALFLGVLAIIGTDIYKYHQFLKDSGNDAHTVVGQYQETSWMPLRDYQRNRILGFISPESVDPRGIGISWNSRQSLQAVGTGGPTGKGWTQGDQAQLGYLPRSVAHNDFIFAVLAEETGFAGASLIVGTFLVLLINNLRIAAQARDRFGLLLGVGVSVIFMIHVFVNIGMTIGLTPITGLPLPFVSYGGSFILSCCILQGLVQSVYRHRRSFA